MEKYKIVELFSIEVKNKMKLNKEIFYMKRYFFRIKFVVLLFGSLLENVFF